MKNHLPLLGRFVLSATVCVGLSVSFSQAQPANNAFDSRTMVTGTNVVVTGSSVGATREIGEPYHAGNSGGASVWWSWTAPTNGAATISTAGSSFDTVLGVYTGSTVSALTEVGSNDDENYPSIITSKVIFDVVSNQTYQIAVDGYDGASGNVRLSVQVGPPPPPPPAPPWVLPDPYGVTVNATSYAGKVIFLNFWATWCGPCKAEMPDLVALQDKYRADGLVIIGAEVSWSGETVQTVTNFLATWTPTVNYQVVMFTAGIEALYGGIGAIPTTFVIDRQNLIQKTYVGTQTRSTFENQLIPLLYGNTRLASQRDGNQMVLRWPTNALAFTLESSTTLVNPSWSTWPTGPTVVNGTNTVSVPATGLPRYFRLRMPY